MEKDIFSSLIKLTYKNGNIPESAARQILYDEIHKVPSESTITISKCKDTMALAQKIRVVFTQRIKRNGESYRLSIKSFPREKMIMIQKREGGKG